MTPATAGCAPRTPPPPTRHISHDLLAAIVAAQVAENAAAVRKAELFRQYALARAEALVTEVRLVALGLDGGPEPIKRQRLRMHEHFQGPFGFGSPDDSEVWDRVQRGAAGGRRLHEVG